MKNLSCPRLTAVVPCHIEEEMIPITIGRLTVLLEDLKIGKLISKNSILVKKATDENLSNYQSQLLLTRMSRAFFVTLITLFSTTRSLIKQINYLENGMITCAILFWLILKHF